MKRYLTADTHFNNINMIDRGLRPEGFNEKTWRGLENLPKGSILIHLGDICFGGDERVHERLAQLPLHRFLVQGNHDNKSKSGYLEHGWHFVCDSYTEKIYGKNILFSHAPTRIFAEEIDLNIHGHLHTVYENADRKLIKFWANKQHDAAFELQSLDSSKHKLLALEYTNYQPVNLEKFIRGL